MRLNLKKLFSPLALGVIAAYLIPFQLMTSTAAKTAVALGGPAKYQPPPVSHKTHSVEDLTWWMPVVQSADATAIAHRSRPIIVAVIDTGADLRQEQIAGNLWINPGESGPDLFGHDRSTNGIDDDQNGFVDDVHGWNFASGKADLADTNGHGTHIAGIIATATRDLRLADGESDPSIQIMVLKYYEPGIDPLAATVKAIDYAVLMGANVINYSGGGLIPSDAERAAIARAGEHGVVVVAAAGNEKSNSDVSPYYPADYDLPNILSVTAIDKNRNILSSSNWGENSVDIAAPGKDIFSTLPEGHWGLMTGTSQATAFASAATALLLSTRTDLKTPAQVIAQILATGEPEPSLDGISRSAASVNMFRHIAMRGENVSVDGQPLVDEDLERNEEVIFQP